MDTTRSTTVRRLRLPLLLGVALLAAALGAPCALADAPLPPAVLAIQQAELTAGSGVTDDSFGFSVALSGDTALVGAFTAGGAHGAVYVFTRTAGVWNLEATLTAGDGRPGDQFGFAVALSGDTALVGAPFTNDSEGAAYVFRRAAGVWEPEATLTPAAGAGGWFGWSVALSGDTALVGAQAATVDGQAYHGAAYVFTRSGTTWSREATLTAGDGAAHDWFGNAVALDGETAVVGDEMKNLSRGAAYVFTRSGTTWSPEATLTASDGDGIDRFGSSVAVSGDGALVGADGDGRNHGAAYFFTRTGTSWGGETKVMLGDPRPNDHFGDAVALDGDTALVGARGRNGGNGAACAYTRSGGVWSQVTTLAPADGRDFGVSVAVDGTTGLAGADYTDFPRGAAFVFVDGAYIVPSGTGPGTVSPDTTQTVAYGSTPRFVFTPQSGYHVSTITVDGTPVSRASSDPRDSYTFPPVTASHRLGVTFAPATFSISAAATTGGGSVSPQGSSTVPWGGSLTVSVTPWPHHHVDSVLVDGSPVDLDGGAHTFANVQANHSLRASFAIDTFTITPGVAGGLLGHGRISPAAAASYAWGTTPAFTFRPDAGYAVFDVRVDGASVYPTPRSGYTFAPLTGPHTISVRFAKAYVPKPQ